MKQRSNGKSSFIEFEKTLRAPFGEKFDLSNYATARPWAPWYVIPADKKWFARLAVARIILNSIRALPMRYPKTPANVRKEFPAAKRLVKQELRVKDAKKTRRIRTRKL